MSHYVHHIPGRLRIRSAAVKKNETKATAAKTWLAGVAGVRSAEVNTLTGSIVVNYDPELTTGPAITTLLREHGYFAQPSLPNTPVPVHGAMANELGSRFAKKLATYAIETAIERSVVVLVGALL